VFSAEIAVGRRIEESLEIGVEYLFERINIVPSKPATRPSRTNAILQRGNESDPRITRY